MRKYVSRMGEATKNKILKVATKLAIKHGLNAINDREVTKKMKVDRSLVFYYFAGRIALRDEVIRRAIEEEVLEIIAQVVILNLPQAATINKKLKRKAFALYLK